MLVRGWRSTKEVCVMIGGILSANSVILEGIVW